METLEPGRGWRNATFHAGTYNGHPIGVAAGLKAVQILGEHPEYYDHVNRLGRQLFSGLQDLADDRRIPAWVEYVGSIGNVYFTTKDEIRNFRDTLSANTRRWWNWFIHCLGNNVLFGGGTGSSIVSGTTSCSGSRTRAKGRSFPRNTRTRTSNGLSRWPTARSLRSRKKHTAIERRPPRSSSKPRANNRPCTARHPIRACNAGRSSQFRVRVSSAISTTRMPRPCAESSVK